MATYNQILNELNSLIREFNSLSMMIDNNMLKHHTNEKEIKTKLEELEKVSTREIKKLKEFFK